MLNVKGLRLDNGDGGKILAGTELGLSVASLINQNKGLISAVKGAGTVTGTTLDNSGGTLSSLNGLVITLDDALINAGIISTEGALSVAAARIDNRSGSLGSAGNLRLTSTGALLNSGGSISTDSALTLNSASLDNSHKGAIFGQGISRVETGAFNNSDGGKLTSGAALTLKAGQVNNASGRIASQQTLDVSLTGLDQQGGELFSKSDLTLDLHNGQLNNQNGLINAPGTLLLKNLNGVNNQNGEISSQQAFALAAQSLDNSNGKLLSQQGLTLRIAAALKNVKGVISGASLDSHSASLDNGQGLISSRGVLLLTADNALNNQLGTVIADGQLTVTADELINSEGSMAGKADVNVWARTVNNQKGQLIATGVLKVDADQLDNRQNGLLGSSQDMSLTVADLDNRGGEISTNGDLHISGTKLDNSEGGKVFTGKALTLIVDEVINRSKGLIDAGTSLDLRGRTLVNGGSLLSQHGLQLTLSGAFDNSQGKVSSEQALTVKTAQLTNSGGSLSSAGELTLNSDGSVVNQGGQIVTDGALVLDSASLDNRSQGTLSAKGAVSIGTGAFDNSHGRLSSADTLNLTAGQVTNGGDGSIGSQNALTASVTGFDQRGGKLFSNSSLSLDLNHGQLNNIGGLINAPGTLLLTQLNGVNNQGGTISSAEAFTLAAQSLDNSNGKLLSNQGLTLRIAAALNNVQGMIGAAAIDVQAASLNNSGGSLVSRGDLDLSVDGLLRNDAKGLISAAQTLEISSGELNNRDDGLINSQGQLTLTATDLDSSNGGEVSASGDIDLHLTSLTQNGGRLLGDKAVTLDLANGNLDNQNGWLTAKGPLTLKRLRDLNNQSGEISSNLGFDLIAQAVNNTSGKIISGEKLLLRGTTLINQKGLLSGWQGLIVNGDSLDNRNGGTLSSKFADVSVDLKNALFNSNAGAVVAQGDLNIKAGSLDNSDKGNLSSAAGLTLTLSGALNNNLGGLISSGAALDIVSTAFTNAGGIINAEQAFNATATRLDNLGGQIASNAAITLDLSGELNNTAGKLAAAGPMLIKGVTDLRNQNGQIASQKSLEARTGSLDNSNKGTIAANDQLQLSATGAVNNSGDGLIYSKNADVQLTAASLGNGKGSIQSEAALTLDVSGDVDNQSGNVIAQNGNVLVKAANIDNRGGTLSSIQGALEARTVGVLRNGFDLNNSRQGGIIQAQGLTLSALAGLNNNGGRISAQAADLGMTTAALDNSSGVLYSKGLLSVSGTSLENAGGQIAANRIDFGLSGALRNGAGVIESTTQLTLKAASVDNQNGRLRSLGNTGKTLFQIGGLLDNRNGVLETANVDMTLALGGFLNGGGQLNHVGRGKFDISTANVIGAGGSIVTGGLLELNADTWSNSNVIQAGRLNINVREFSQTASGKLLASDALRIVGGNWTNDGLIASDGSIDMRLSGNYGGNGRLTSLRDTYLSAASMNLGAAGSFAAGASSTIKIDGQLLNAGRITSGEDLTVNAGSLVNHGTLGAAQNLIVKAPVVLNDRGLIFSGNDMTLNVGTLTNQSGDFYGLGNVVIAGYSGGTRAAGVYNISGSMESGGGFTLDADVFENRTEGPTASAERKLISGFIAATCGDCVGGTFNNFLATRETYQFIDTDNSASAVLNVGKDFVFHGGTFLNSKSTIAAGGGIDITAVSLKNIGTQSGTIEVTRQYNFEMGTGTTAQFMANVIMPYNQRNNPDFPFMYYVIAPEGLIRKAIAKTVGNSVVIVDAETGANVGNSKYGRAMSGYSAGFETSTPSLYDPNNLLAIPTELTQFQKGDAVEVSVDGAGAPGTTTGRNAVIQAGGKVSINATKEIENSVIQQDYSASGGTNKVADTSVSNSNTTVVRINSQLPPDLAQQQVNPLSLPGFSLPTGENGLFRLSGQGRSDAVAGNIGPAPTWTVATESVSALDHMVAGTAGGPRNLFVDGPAPVSDSTRAVDTFHRTPTVVKSVASEIDVKLPQSSAGPGMKDRGNDAKESIDTRPVTRVTGLPDTQAPSNPHKYLIETNPALTDLKSFMSSDYLLDKLGYDPDQSAKRLGDGLYEQRLIQQAVTARTGQAFLDGQTSNEGMFKYLMNNAIASKDALNLSVGVGLTSQQVAALTHDIVWLEEHEVNGEKVLVPVVYLAQANGRLGPTGALIAGNDVTLIAGENLDNVGTLKATNNLSATAGKDLINSGSIEAGNRLDLLATNNIINKAGGIITGKDVSLTSRTGDVINERTITSMDDQYGSVTRHQDFADNAARIEAVNDLTIKAAKDINVIGGVLKSGQDMALDAGRDVNVASVQVNDSMSLGSRANASDITQLGAEIGAGRDFKADAKRDINVIASEIDAKRDVSMKAADNLLISSAADEEHSRSRNKKEKRQEDHVTQVMSGITAGGDVSLAAGQNLAVVSSRVTAGDEAYLVAGDRLDILAAQDTDYSLYDMKKKGSFGKKKTKHDEVTDVKNISSEITSGGSMLLASGGDQRYQAAKLDSGNDLVISSGGAVTFEGVKDLHQESHTKSNTSLAWNSMSGKGKTDETLRQSQLLAKGQLVINAVDGLNIDIKQINQKSISQTIDVMVKADPQLAWLKEAEKRGDVDWKLIKETHDSFKYSSSSLGQGAMLVIIIVVTVLTAGAASAAVGSVAGATAGSGTAMAAAGTATASAVAGGAAVGSTVAAGLGNVMASAVLTSMASTAAVSTINNKGNLGAVAKDTFSKDSLKNSAIAGATAGFTKGVIDPQLGGHTVPFNNLTKGFDLNTLQGIGGFAVHAGAQGLAGGAIKTVIGGGSYSDNLKEGLVSQAGNVAAATAFNFVGGYAQNHWQAAKDAGDTTGMAIWAEGGVARTAMHALMGGAISSATGGDFKTGAVAAGASQAMASVLNSTFDTQPELRQAFSQIVGLTAAGLAGGDVNKASWVALMADEYNRQLHQKETLALEKLQKENPDKAYQLKAAACALVHCSASVPPDDPQYETIKALETDGKGFKDAQGALFATGAFDEYSKWDQVNDDLLLNDKNLRQSANASRAVLGAIGAAAGFGGAIVSSPACVTAVGCAIPALSGLGGVASFADGWQATGELFAPYEYSQGSKVLDSFSSATYPGDVNPLRDYGTEAAKAAMEIALLKGAGKYLEGSGELLLTSGGKKGGSLPGSTSEVDKVEFNATRDAEGFGLSAQRDFVPGKEHRAENINAGQVTDRDGLPRVDGEKTANDQLLKQQSGGIDAPYWGTQRPAWMEGTIVTDKVVDQPRTMTMVIDQRQFDAIKGSERKEQNPASFLGGWATDSPVNSMEDVRNKLAISTELKTGNLYRVEFTVKPGVGIREGTAGDMWDATQEKRLAGGAHQVNFMDKTPRTNPELYNVNIDSLRLLK